jgi:hypothetical protein
MTEQDFYVHLYDTDTEFVTDYDGDVYHEPWVSYTIENKKVNYNKKETFTITYLNRNGGTSSTQTITGHSGQDNPFNVKSAPESWGEHTFLGWAEVEWPTYEQIQQAGFLKEPGTTSTVTGNTTLHAVYSTTFQGLINEGYVNMNVYPETYNIGVGNCMFVKPNGYPKELVVDFQEVFDCNPDKLVSTGGTVGSGTSKNVFCFKDTSAHWLTDDEWYNIYNGTELQHAVASLQFYGLNWSDKESITIKYRGNNWQVGTSTFGPNSPRVVNIHFLSGTFGYMFKTYGHTGNGCGAEVINFSNAAGTKVSMSRPTGGNGGFNAAFEGCRNLKEIHNLNFSTVTNWLYAFDGCRALEEIPASDFGTEWTMVGPIYQLFCNNLKLETIEPVMKVSAVTYTNSSFGGCTSLTEFYLYGINAATNVNTGGGTYPQDTAYTWDLHSTKMTQACADYMITNLTPCDPTTQGFVMKGVNFPTGITLTSSQKASLRDNGWIPYINGVEQ